VAIFRKRATDAFFKPVPEKKGEDGNNNRSEFSDATGKTEEIKATTISGGNSAKTTAGRRLLPVKSVKGNRTRTISPR
jgi:hypothetical protein